MATSFGQPTYAQIIDDLRFDVGNGAKLALLSDEAIQKWILDAQEEVSKRIHIKETYALGLNNGVSDYPFQDRPLITAIAAGPPPSITAAGHGLSTDDRINLAGVNGMSGLTGSFAVTVTTADIFQVRRAFDVTDASNESPISLSVEAHGLTTGTSVTVSGVLGNTAANGTFAITVTGVNSFTLDGSTGNGTYTGGGLVTANPTTSGTYTTGGRFWKDDEIPTHFHRVTALRRPWGEFIREAVPEDIAWILNKEKDDTIFVRAFTSWDAPSKVAEYSQGGQRILKCYPAPLEDKTSTLYGAMRPIARNYTGDSLTATIVLPAEYEHILRHYVKAQMYDHLDDEKRWTRESALFEKAVAEFNLNKVNHPRMTVRYT